MLSMCKYTYFDAFELEWREWPFSSVAQGAQFSGLRLCSVEVLHGDTL